MKYYQPTFYLPDFSAVCNNEYFTVSQKESIVNKEWFERIDWSEYDITKEFRKEDDIGKLEKKLEKLDIDMNKNATNSVKLKEQLS